MSTDTITRDEVDELRRDRDNYRTQCNLARKERAEAIASRDSARRCSENYQNAASTWERMHKKLSASRDTARTERDEARRERHSAREAAQSHFDAYKAQGEHLRTLRADLARANESATLYLDTFRSESAINRELRAQIKTLDYLLNKTTPKEAYEHLNPMKPKLGA